MSKGIDFIKRELTLTTTLDKVWTAITEPEQVQKWFGSKAVYELTEGSIGFFEWDNACEGKYALKIKAIEPKRYFAWWWMNEANTDFDETEATLVEWTLSKTVTGDIHLEMLESGFKAESLRKMNIEGWRYELADLEEFVTSGGIG